MSRDLPQRPEPLPAPTTDAHTHLLSTQEFSGLPVAELIERAAEVGVHRLVEVGCDLPSSRGAIEIAQNHPAVVACVAIHPNDAARAGDRLPAELDALEALVAEGFRRPAARLAAADNDNARRHTASGFFC